MKKNLIIFLLSLFIFTACATIGDMMQADRNIRKVELGMSKKQIISIMGKTYQGMGAYALPEGDAEIIGYYNSENGVYKLHLLDDKLIRWEFEPPRRTPNHHTHPH